MGASNREISIAGKFVIFVHCISLFSLIFYSPKQEIIRYCVATHLIATFGITMGYHRLWSHRCFEAVWPLRVLLAFAGTFAAQGSIKWFSCIINSRWTIRHRLHHRYTDTDHDPYDAKKGFWFSHIGWLLENPRYQRLKWIDVKDLESDPIAVFQHKYFKELALLQCLVLPTVYGWMVDDMIGGFLYGGYVARISIWHVTWAINSFAHWYGDQEYSDQHTARGSLILAVLAHGEGNHNYHHEFPRDYRNGVKAFDYDPTKWAIKICSMLGMANNLVKVDDTDIAKAKINSLKSKHNLGQQLVWTNEQSLPVWSLQEFESECDKNELIIIDGYAIDVVMFKHGHPGGSDIINKYVGKDATKAFYGVLNNHTQSARQLVMDLRVAKVSIYEE